MRKKIILSLAALVCALCCAFGITACTQTDKPTGGHDHAYAWVDNGDGTHKQHCANGGCNAPDINAGTHTWGTDDKCEQCGAVKPAEGHDHAYAWVDNGDGTHKQHCANGGCNAPDINAGAHTWGADDKCEQCGAVKPAEGHDHAYAWVDNGDGTHKQHCANGGCNAPDINAGTHIWGADDKCEQCGAVKPAEDDGMRLTFALNTDGDGYTVTGVEKDSATDIVIPASYEGKPVTAIGEQAFYAAGSHANGVEITSIQIPSSVTEIGDYAFYGAHDLKKVVIPETVKTVGKQLFRYSGIEVAEIYCSEVPYAAFWTSSAIEKVVLGDGVKTIGEHAFRESGLKEIQIGTGLETVSNYAFYQCEYLESVSLPASATSIGQYSFRGCAALKQVNIAANSSLNTIGKYAFYRCDALTQVNIGANASLGTIESYAFEFCSKLQTFTVAADTRLVSIGSYAFYCCDLRSMTIPATVTSIGSYAFYSNNRLVEVRNLSALEMEKGTSAHGYVAAYALNLYTSASVGNHFLSIGDYEFYDDGTNAYLIGYHGNDTALTLPANCNGKNYEIYKQAFMSRTMITKVTIPAGVTAIGDSAFAECVKLVEVCNQSAIDIQKNSNANGYVGKYASNIYASGGASKLTNIGGYEFYSDGNDVRLMGYTGSETALTLPASCNGKSYEIYGWAFYNRADIQSVSLGSGATKIGDSAFEGCTGIKSLTVLANVKSIGFGAFRGCTGLTELTFEEGVTEMDGNVFDGCSALTGVTLPASVTDIGSSVFAGCGTLSSLAVAQGNTAYRGEGNCIIEIATSTVIAGCKNSVIPAGVVEIGFGAFAGCTGLTGITIPDGVTIIGWYAFDGCTALKSVVLPQGLTEIGMYAFNDCDALTAISIPDSVTSIGASAFFSCGSLTGIVIPEGVKEIKSDTFGYCTSLASVTIPASVTKFGNYAFRDCSKLVTVNYGGTVEEWGAIKRGTLWNTSTGKYTVACSDGTTAKS